MTNIKEEVKEYIDHLREEEKRDKEFLHITAYENQMSETARKFLCSKLSERYFFGGGDEDGLVDFGVFALVGLKSIGDIVSLAEEATKKMLKASIVNLTCLSGVHAMMCAILSTTNPGDSVMVIHHDQGGHFATEGILKVTGRKPIFASYNLEELKFDTEKMAKDFKKNNCSALYMDVSYYINPHNLREIRKALGEEATIIFDASHTIGLILGQQFQSPLEEGANVICANTHKTLPGPQKGLIAFRDNKLGEKANDKIEEFLHSSPHTHHMGALAITLLEMEKYGKEYASQIISNSNALGKELAKLGYNVRKANTGRFSENHQVHLFIHDKGKRKELYHRLYQNNISANFDNVLGGRLFVRIGTQELTRRGMKEKEMGEIAILLDKAIKGENVKEKILDLNKRFLNIAYSFDSIQ